MTAVEPVPEPKNADPSALWPSREYALQLARLREAVGSTIYLVEVASTDTRLSVSNLGKPHQLLGVLPFPRPDPARGLAPHFLLLDDGRGINLGRVVRISLGRPFAPLPEQVLYLDRALECRLLSRDRRLSREFITRQARLALGQLLGHPERPALGGPGEVGSADEG